MGFKFNGQATLSSVNVRSENHGDEPTPAVDLIFEADDIDASHLFPVLGIDGDKEQEQAFMAGMWDEDGPRFSGIGGISCWAKFEGHHKIGGTLSASSIPVNKLHKFSFLPRGVKRADVKFTVSITEPPDHLLDSAAHNLKDRITINIEHDPELDLNGEQEESEQEEAA